MKGQQSHCSLNTEIKNKLSKANDIQKGGEKREKACICFKVIVNRRAHRKNL